MEFCRAVQSRWLMIFVLVGFLPSSLIHGQTSYDLVLKGGHVIDPKNGIDGIRDVAIKDHKIAAVAEHIQVAPGTKVVDVAGFYVTPGLVDIHVHVYASTGERHSYAGDHGLYPDGFTLRTGVTTAVDAGSSGWKNFPDFKDHVIDRSITRILAFINIVGAGMRPKYEQNLDEMDAQAAAETAMKYPQVIVGIKTAHYDGPEWTPVERAVQAGTIANIPVMVDFGTFRPERPYQELVSNKLRPGDISTHMYLDDVPMLDAQGKILPYLFAARKRGVIFDVGHGGGSFIFRQAAPAIRQGFVPSSISTDLHNDSMNSGMKDMLNVMSKFLNLGVPLDDVIRMSTSNPAHEIKHDELGNLSVGSDADVAVLHLEKGRFGFVDTYGARMLGDQKLVCELTVRDGRVVWDLNGITREDWTKLGHYQTQGSRVWDHTIIDP
ncbi:MAG: amidohydrolase/deacetylase family metallohydrolase [Acidobacteriaceae bacterium]